MIQKINDKDLEYFQLDLGGICYLGFTISSVLNSLTAEERTKQLTFLN